MLHSLELDELVRARTAIKDRNYRLFITADANSSTLDVLLPTFKFGERNRDVSSVAEVERCPGSAGDLHLTRAQSCPKVEGSSLYSTKRGNLLQILVEPTSTCINFSPNPTLVKTFTIRLLTLARHWSLVPFTIAASPHWALLVPYYCSHPYESHNVCNPE